MEIRVDGSAQLRRLADTIRASGDRGLGREMSAALRQAAKPVQSAILREATAVMPSGGGYQAALSKSLRFRTQLKNTGRQASFRLTTYADGRSERRDIRSLNRGYLRHPVYGRSRLLKSGQRQPNPWANTSIRAGFFDRGTDKAADEAERQMYPVLDAFAARLTKG